VTTVDEVLDVLRRCEFHYASEYDLQAGIAAALEGEGLNVHREVRLGASDRIDVLVDRVGIEVKVAGSTEAAVRQCTRYLQSDQLDDVILVTSRARHQVELDPALPIHVHQVLRPW
jgi:hypothetical protein